MTLVLPETKRAAAADLRRLAGVAKVRDDRTTLTVYPAQAGEGAR